MIERQSATRIAVVEDNIDLACLFKKLLDQKGMCVSFVAYDGDEAVKKFVECSPKPDIVIMDYRLPTKDGIETMREILMIGKGTHIIFISADSDVEKESLQAGAAFFLKKPASIQDIYHAIYTVSGYIQVLNRCPSVKMP